MSIQKEFKKQLIQDYATSTNDTGSVEVQTAILTERIKNITEHLKTHQQDYSCRRGLLILVARRKRLLNYLKNDSKTRYEALIAKLGLRK